MSTQKKDKQKYQSSKYKQTNFYKKQSEPIITIPKLLSDLRISNAEKQNKTVEEEQSINEDDTWYEISAQKKQSTYFYSRPSVINDIAAFSMKHEKSQQFQNMTF